MTDPKGKRMTAEELAELRAVVQAAQDHPYPSIKVASTIAAKFADHIAALEAENKSLREERDVARTDAKIDRDFSRSMQDANAAISAQLALLTRLTRPPSAMEVSMADAWLTRIQHNPYIAAYEAANAQAVLRRLAQANKTLPDWNTLSNEARDAMKEAAGFHVSDAWAAQCALDVYNAGRRALSTQGMREYDRSRRP